MNTLRKSLKLKRQKSGRIELQTSNIAQTKTNKANSSFRFSQSFRNLTSSFKVNNVSEEAQKSHKVTKLAKARQRTICFFRAGSKQELVEFRTELGLKLTKHTGSTMKTYKKHSKNNSTCVIGDGRIIFTCADDEFNFEVNHIDNIHISSMKSKEVLMTFRGDDKIFFCKFDNAGLAQMFARSIFIEMRRLCYVLDKIAFNLVPEEFRLSQNLEAIHKLSADEKQTVELTLRELVDLCVFSRGIRSMPFVEASKMFGNFLVAVNAEEEGNYWLGISNLASRAIDRSLDDPESKKKRNVLQEIRNPDELEEQTLLKAKSVPENADSLMQRVENGLTQAAKALQRQQY